MIPIFIPLPAVSSAGPQSLSAPITSGPWVIAACGSTRDGRARRTTRSATSCAIPGTFASSGTLLVGQDDREAVRDDAVAPADLSRSGIAASRLRSTCACDAASLRAWRAARARRRRAGVPVERHDDLGRRDLLRRQDSAGEGHGGQRRRSEDEDRFSECG